MMLDDDLRGRERELRAAGQSPQQIARAPFVPYVLPYNGA
jgi:hypothetical protein